MAGSVAVLPITEAFTDVAASTAGTSYARATGLPNARDAGKRASLTSGMAAPFESGRAPDNQDLGQDDDSRVERDEQGNAHAEAESVPCLLPVC